MKKKSAKKVSSAKGSSAGGMKGKAGSKAKNDSILEGVPLALFWETKPKPPLVRPLNPTPYLSPWVMHGDLRRTPEEIQAIAESVRNTIYRLKGIISHGEFAHTRKAASRALADVAHGFFTTWPTEHVTQPWQKLYDNDAEFKKRWEQLGKKGRRKGGEFGKLTVEDKVVGFIKALNRFVVRDLCDPLECSSELRILLKQHDPSEHDRLTMEFQNRHELGREMQRFLQEGREDYKRLVAEPINNWDLLDRECARRFDEYWQRIICPVLEWALPQWLDSMQSWKDVNGASLPKCSPSKWKRTMKAALNHSLKPNHIGV